MTFILSGFEDRTVFISVGGDDDNRGDSLMLSKLTHVKAIETLEALTPPPSLANVAVGIGISAGRFNEQIDIPEGVQYLVGIMQFESDQPYTVSLSDASQIQALAVLSNGVDTSAILIDGKASVGVAAATISSGTGSESKCIEIKNGSEEFSMKVARLIVNGGYGIHNTAINLGGPSLFNISEIKLAADGAVGALFDHLGGRTTFSCSSIFPTSGAVNTSGIVIEAGDVVLAASDITADTAVLVKSGGTLTLLNDKIVGDIIVEVGGVLRVLCLSHTGTVTNAGEIDGKIGSVRFGADIVNDLVTINFSKAGSFDTEWQDIGFFSIETTTDTIQTMAANWVQSSSQNRTAEFRVVDTLTPTTVYFANSLTVAGVGSKFLDVKVPITPLPTDQMVSMTVQAQRVGAAGINNPSILITYTQAK